MQDIVGLYMSPPNRSIVLCVDEKSQIQALDREQPVLDLSRLRSGLFRAMFAMKEIMDGKKIHRPVPA